MNPCGREHYTLRSCVFIYFVTWAQSGKANFHDREREGSSITVHLLGKMISSFVLKMDMWS